MLAALHVLAELGGQADPLSELLAQFSRYASSGEINSEVADVTAATDAVRARFASVAGATVDELDGLTVELPDGSWFNLRPSNTEPLLRLNVEAPTPELVAQLRDDVLAAIQV
jgi:phosphomannomutase